MKQSGFTSGFFSGTTAFPGVAANSATPANPGEAKRETTAATIARRGNRRHAVVRREGARAFRWGPGLGLRLKKDGLDPVRSIREPSGVSSIESSGGYIALEAGSAPGEKS